MKKSFTMYLFYGDLLIHSYQTAHANPDDVFKHDIETFFRYACNIHGFRTQIELYETTLKNLVRDLRSGVKLSTEDSTLLGVCYMTLWKFGKIPYEDILILKRVARLKAEKKTKERVNEYSETRFATRTHRRKRTKKRF